MRNGRRMVSEWLTALCSVSGATTHTSCESSRATFSRSLMPLAWYPSSLVTRMRVFLRSRGALNIILAALAQISLRRHSREGGNPWFDRHLALRRREAPAGAQKTWGCPLSPACPLWDCRRALSPTARLEATHVVLPRFGATNSALPLL